MTVLLSRAIIKNLIIQEMRLSAPNRHSLTSSMSSNDDVTKTLDIDDETEIDDIPSFMDSFNDKTMFDFDSDIEDFGIDMDMDDEDFEFESETEEDSESETEYNQFGQLGMSGSEIRKHVTDIAKKLSKPMRGKNKRSRAEMAYDDLVRQGREVEMDDPEFMKTNDLDRIDQHTLELPADRSRKQLKEVIRREIRQSIKRRLLYT
jgi:hypothetical protein